MTEQDLKALIAKHNGDANKALAEFARQATARIAELEAEKNAPLRVRHSDTTGTVMVLGLNSFPLSLYADQWDRLSDFLPAIKRYIVANADAIKAAEAKGKAAKAAAAAEKTA